MKAFCYGGIPAAVLTLLLAPAAHAQGDDIPTASFYSSLIGGEEQMANAPDFQNASPRPEWGNPVFAEQIVTVTSGAPLLQRQGDNDSLIPMNGMAGLELDAVLHLREFNLEFGWLGVFSEQTTQYLPVFAGGSLPTSPPIGFTSNGLLFTQYSSDLNSFELNFRLPMSPNFTGIGGLRYINLHEAVHLTETSPTQVLGWKTTTSNNLFGLQAGGDLAFARIGRFQMNAVAKGGIFVNSIEQDGTIVGFPSPGNLIVDDGTAKAAFLGELKLMGTYRFTDRVAVSAGYQAIWLSNIALAQNQFQAINLASGSGIDSSANPLFHGAVIQGIVSW